MEEKQKKAIIALNREITEDYKRNRIWTGIEKAYKEHTDLLLAEIERLEADLETEQLQLAACIVATIQNRRLSGLSDDGGAFDACPTCGSGNLGSRRLIGTCTKKDLEA